ncbi:response regulator [Undibacter mobilis]|nr:response regulator [Undibacter mobilis]
MNHEFVSLNMMLIGFAGSELELWRQGVALASIPVDLSVYDTAPGIAALAQGGVDICVLDGGLPDAVKQAALASTKALRSRPYLFVRAARGAAMPAGMTGMLTKPVDVADAHRLVELCVRTKLPTRALVVDDSSTMRGIVRKILSACRFQLELHESEEGLAALERLRREPFDLVFLDYNMPGFDGCEILSEIKREVPQVAVVMMTATVDTEVADRAAALGALGFLRKPFYPADIDRLLDRFYGFAV